MVRFLKILVKQLKILLFRQSNTIVHALFLIRLDTDGIRISIFFPNVDAITFFPLLLMLLIFFRLESGNPIDKVPQYVKIDTIIVLYNASAALDIKRFLIFLVMFTLLAALLLALSKCVASVKVGSKCTLRYL